ncbi:signal peptidase II [Ornithinimicrobium murale]|uniref:signal peptidase II n=1 Tax=Ornithinimicrobium murale TaxID=1050153 RepID=UPI00192D243F|nr:signal peptidase II [Ornithinimicrobium murale]
MQAEAGAALTPEAGDDATDSPARPHRRSLFWLVLAIAVAWVTTDQITKNIAEDALSDGSTHPFIGELLQFHLTYNSGAAFSIGTGSTGLLTILAVTVCVVIIWNARRLGSLAWAIGLGLLLGGALGNLTDRLIREPSFGKGHVVDFLMLPNFPIFNIADIGITSAAILIGLLALRGINPDGTLASDEDDKPRKKRGRHAAASAAGADEAGADEAGDSATGSDHAAVDHAAADHAEVGEWSESPQKGATDGPNLPKNGDDR